MSSTEPKFWTVMVYFAADNNLDSNAVRNLYDMWQFISATTDEKIHLVAQVDREAQNIPTTRYHFTGGDKGKFQAYAVEELKEETDSGSAEDLVGFVRWAVETQQLRAHRYMLVLWGHGKALDDGDGCEAAPQPKIKPVVIQGALPQFQKFTKELSSLNAEQIQDILSGISNTDVFGPDKHPATVSGASGTLGHNDLPPDSLNNLELKQALTEIRGILGKKLDVLGMDACLMGLAEFYFQVRESVEHAVGSQETIPTDSWPYMPILKAFNTKPDAETTELTGEIVRHYVEFYKEAKTTGTTLSACNLGKSESLRSSVSELGQTLIANLTDEVMKALAKARRRTQAFFVTDYVDLVDFCEKLHEECDLQIVREKCQAVIDAVTKAQFVTSSMASKNLEKTAHGISIYLPVITSCYAGLDFSRETQWDEFLFAFMSRALNRQTLSANGSGAGAALTPGVAKSTLLASEEITMSTKVIVIAVTDKMGISDPDGNPVPFDPTAVGRNFVLVPAELEILVPAASTIKADGTKISEGTSTKTNAEVEISHPTISPFLKLPAGAHLLDLGTGNFPSLREGTKLNSTDGTPITVPPNTILKGI